MTLPGGTLVDPNRAGDEHRPGTNTLVKRKPPPSPLRHSWWCVGVSRQPDESSSYAANGHRSPRVVCRVRQPEGLPGARQQLAPPLRSPPAGARRCRRSQGSW